MLDKILERLSSRERTAAIITVFIISLMAMDRMIVAPVISSMGVLDRKIEEKERVVKADLRIWSKKEEIMKESKYYDRYSLDALPAEEEWASLLGVIENLAGESDIYLVNVSPEGTKKEGFLQVYVVNVDCEGQMSQIIHFIHSIENSRKLLAVKALQIKLREMGSDIIDCSLSIVRRVIPE